MEPPTIKKIPYGDFTEREAQKLAGELRTKMSSLMGERKLQVIVMENKALPAKFKSAGRDRYREDSITHSLERTKERNVIKMGVTHEDIATTVHGIQDFGVLGLSFVPGQSCVVSTYRVKDEKNQFWKVAVHESLHAVGLRHCPADDDHCLMQDAKKHPKFEIKEGLCPICDSLLKIRLH